jgi:hypothetical protein
MSPKKLWRYSLTLQEPKYLIFRIFHRSGLWNLLRRSQRIQIGPALDSVKEVLSVRPQLLGKSVQGFTTVFLMS